MFSLQFSKKMENSNKTKIEAQCRICLIQKPTMLNIQEYLKSYRDITILQASETLMGCKIPISNRTPQNICSECFELLQKSYNLKIKYQHVQRKLLKLKLSNLEELMKNNECSDREFEDYSEFVEEFKGIVEGFDEDKYEEIAMEPQNDVTETVSKNNQVETETIIIQVNSECIDTKQVVLNRSDTLKSNLDSLKKCDFCNYRTESSHHLKKHSIKMHGRLTTYNCKSCGYTAVSRSHFTYHKTKKHSHELKLMCKICGFKPMNMLMLQEHAKKHIQFVYPEQEEEIIENDTSNTSQFEEITLEFVADTEEESKEKLDESRDENIELESSDTDSNEKTVIKQSKKQTSTKEPVLLPEDYHEYADDTGLLHYKCNRCDFKSITMYNLRFHIIRKHKRSNMHKCRLCDYSAPVEQDVKRHMKRRHHQIRDYKCDRCDYSAVTSFELQRHADSVHLKKYRLQCDRCPFSTNRPSNFDKHAQNVHGIKKSYACDVCDYVTALAERLEQHRNRVHLKLRTFECEQCDYRAFTEAFLKRHVLNAHKDKKACPFAYCEYKSKFRRHIDRHVRHVHAGEEVGEEPEF